MNEGKDNKSNVLIENSREYFLEGKEALARGRYNSASVLFFKALVSLIDLYLLQKTGKAPSSHAERFIICKNKFYDAYDLLDKDFPFYQDSYIKALSKEIAEVIKEDAEFMAEKAKVKLQQ